MKKINALKKLHIKSQLIYHGQKELLLKVMKDSDIIKTSNVMHSFVIKGDYFVDAILDLSSSKNVYASNVLLRSFIEHFLRFEYIAMKAVDGDRNDNMGEDYLVHLHELEDRDLLKAWDLIGKTVVLPDDLNPILKFEKLKALKNTPMRDEDRVRAQQFQYKKIINYLYKRLEKGSQFDPKGFVLQILPTYGKLSSFVHGGPLADRIMTAFNHRGSFNSEMFKIVYDSVCLNIYIKALSLKLYEGEYVGFEHHTTELIKLHDEALNIIN